jgi:hypothetical protein
MARDLDCSCPQWGLHRPGCKTGLGVARAFFTPDHTKMTGTKPQVLMPKSASQSWDDLIAENMKALKALEDAKKAATSGQNKPSGTPDPALAPSGGQWHFYGGPGIFGPNPVERLFDSDISQQETKEMPAIEVELCSAKPPCGLPDEECWCGGKNCPPPRSKSCWKCGAAK